MERKQCKSSVCTTMSENDDKLKQWRIIKMYVLDRKIIDIERYNSYRKLNRITAYVMRFATNCRATETERKKELLRIDEIENAKFLWIRYTQVHGNWGGWGAWNRCPVTCGGGRQISNRACNDPSPLYGGSACSGNSKSSVAVLLNECQEMKYKSS
ncbi:Hypothetical predicted protein [Mytilus galloprovincialis]|uniref:Uncharacterized protein n=1 Tax=Mytilus galloprovincialis TaxID=29158 RepID=A0A8B6GKI3_MYTGA|nr:Hypothetical predicted protein [Mytilus galloprovincialis]